MTYTGFNSLADIRIRLALAEQLTTTEFIVSSAGEQQILLARPAIAGILSLNGLIQNPAYYALSERNLTVPTAMGVQPGDVITFTY
jgi:hypothetical protein